MRQARRAGFPGGGVSTSGKTSLQWHMGPPAQGNEVASSSEASGLSLFPSLSRETSMPWKSAISSACESYAANRSLGRKRAERRRIRGKCHLPVRIARRVKKGP